MRSSTPPATQQLSRLLLRLIRAPRSLLRIASDRLLAPGWIGLQGVEMGRRCRFAGLPVVRLHPEARIMLGDRVSLNSRSDANPRGIHGPTILAALEPSSMIDIGDDCGLSGVSIVARSGIRIGRRCLFGPGSRVWDNNGHALNRDARRRGQQRFDDARPITIEDDVFVGAGALILRGVTIGQGAVIGADAVVRSSVHPGMIAVGNPARTVALTDRPRAEVAS